MVKKNYQCSEALEEAKDTAKAMMVGAPASLKYCTEIAREIKGKPLSKAVARLTRILNKEEFLPLRKYNRKVAHRKGNTVSFVKSGRYPRNTTRIFLDLLENAKNNADEKGLDTEKLLVVHAFASQGRGRTRHQTQGRISGKAKETKSTHLEVVVREGK